MPVGTFQARAILKTKLNVLLLIWFLSAVQGAAFPPEAPMQFTQLKDTELEDKLIDFLFVSNSTLVALNII